MREAKRMTTGKKSKVGGLMETLKMGKVAMVRMDDSEKRSTL